jgi:hypothetical protein
MHKGKILSDASVSSKALLRGRVLKSIFCVVLWLSIASLVTSLDKHVGGLLVIWRVAQHST